MEKPHLLEPSARYQFLVGALVPIESVCSMIGGLSPGWYQDMTRSTAMLSGPLVTWTLVEKSATPTTDTGITVVWLVGCR